MQQEVSVSGEKADIRYYYNRVDLNGDGENEVLAFVFGEHQCGTGGCYAALYRRLGREYKLVTGFGPARNPIIVSEHKTNGWNDLIFINAGGGINPSYHSVNRFDSSSYQENPTIDSKVPPLKQRVRGVSYLSGPYHPPYGLRLPEPK